jgi:hypothetical protein
MHDNERIFFFSNLNKGHLKSLFLNNKYGGDIETVHEPRIPFLLTYSPIVVELRGGSFLVSREIYSRDKTPL